MAQGLTGTVTLGVDIGCRVTHSVNQSILDSTATILAFDTERWDTDGIHDPVTNNSRLTVVTAGKYVICANVEWDFTGVGIKIFSLRLRLNGTTEIGRNARRQEDVAVQALCTIYDLAVSDYVEVQVRQVTSSTINVVKTDQFSPEFMMQRIA